MSILVNLMTIAVAIALCVAGVRLGRGRHDAAAPQPARPRPGWLLTLAIVLCLLLGLAGLFLSACGGLMMMAGPAGQYNALLFLGVMSLLASVMLIVWLCSARAALWTVRVLLVLIGLGLALWALVPAHQ